MDVTPESKVPSGDIRGAHAGVSVSEAICFCQGTPFWEDRPGHVVQGEQARAYHSEGTPAQDMRRPGQSMSF